MASRGGRLGAASGIRFPVLAAVSDPNPAISALLTITPAAAAELLLRFAAAVAPLSSSLPSTGVMEGVAALRVSTSCVRVAVCRFLWHTSWGTRLKVPAAAPEHVLYLRSSVLSTDFPVARM